MVVPAAIRIRRVPSGSIRSVRGGRPGGPGTWNRHRAGLQVSPPVASCGTVIRAPVVRLRSSTDPIRPGPDRRRRDVVRAENPGVGSTAHPDAEAVDDPTTVVIAQRHRTFDQHGARGHLGGAGPV